MRKTVLGIVLAMSVVVMAVAAFPGAVHAATVCYRFDLFPAERWVLDVKRHSVLSSGQEAHSVHGKEVGGAGGGSMSGVYGTVVVNKNFTHPPVGAHMSIQDGFVGGGLEPVFLDCTSTETSPTPAVWTCLGVMMPSLTARNTTLTRIAADPACLVFEELVGEGEKGSSQP